MTNQQELEPQDAPSLAELQEQARQSQVIFNFFRRHPEVVPNEANKLVIRRFFANAPEELSVWNIEAALGSGIKLEQLALEPVRPEPEIEPAPDPKGLPEHITMKRLRAMNKDEFRQILEKYEERLVLLRYAGKG